MKILDVFYEIFKDQINILKDEILRMVDEILSEIIKRGVLSLNKCEIIKVVCMYLLGIFEGREYNNYVLENI